MGVAKIVAAADALPGVDRRESVAAIGILKPSAFDAAAAAIPTLAGYADYDDWLDAREGSQMGLALAGVDAELVPVSLDALLAWARMTAGAPDEAELDRLAALVRLVRLTPNATALAAVGRLDFEAWSGRFGAAVDVRDFVAWTRRRIARRAELAAAGARIFELPVRLDDVAAWCACVGLRLCESALDAYATLLLDLLATD